MRSCVMSGQPAHLVQELNAGTVYALRAGPLSYGGVPCFYQHIVRYTVFWNSLKKLQERQKQRLEIRKEGMLFTWLSTA